eukprot:2203904-Prymnesium_polylepis.1
MDDTEYYSALESLLETAGAAGVFDRMEPTEVEVTTHPTSPARNAATGNVLEGFKVNDKVLHKVHKLGAHVLR